MVDPTNIDPGVIREGADALNTFTKADKAFSEEMRRTMRSVNEANRIFPRLGKSVTTLGNQFFKVTNHIEEFGERSEVALQQMDSAFLKAAKNVNVSTLKMLSAFRPILVSFNEQARRAGELQISLGNLSQEYVKSSYRLTAVAKTYALTSSKLDELRVKQVEYENIMKRGGKIDLKVYKEHQVSLFKAYMAMQKVTAELENEKTGHTNTTTAIAEQTQELNKLEEELVSVYDKMKDVWMQQHRIDIANRQNVGGFGAVRASVKSLAIESGALAGAFKAVLGGGLLLYGLKQVADFFVTTTSYMNANRQVALQLGQAYDTGALGAWDYAKSLAGVTTASVSAAETAGETGLKIEEVNDVMSKFRLGTLVDRAGRLSEEAIGRLTKETAYFARVTGIDATEAAEMMNKRIAQMGMTAEEAVADMQMMRATLDQMAKSSGKNNVATRDMVKIIDDAANASQSYVVDTRILTAALRGATNQASSLGAAQKQAQDVAKGIGKVLSGAPEYISLPVGFKFIDQLLGSDADAFLDKFDAETKSQLKSIQAAVKSGSMMRYSAAKAVMGLVGESEQGMQATFDHMSKMFLNGSSAVELIAQTYGIDNRATAAIVTKHLKDAKEIQETMGRENASLMVAMARQGATFDEQLGKVEGAENKLAKLKELGLDEKSAQQYWEIQKGLTDDVKKKIADINNQKARGVALTAEDDKYLKDYYGKLIEQNKILQSNLDPVEKVRSAFEQISKTPGLSKTAKIQIDPKELEKHSKELADVLRDAQKDNAAFNKEISAQDLANEVAKRQAAKVAQDKMIDDWITKFSEGPVKATSDLIRKHIPQLNSPWTRLVVAIVALGAIIAGTKRWMPGLLRLTMAPPVRTGTYHGTLEALTRFRLTGGFSQLGGPGTGTPKIPPSTSSTYVEKAKVKKTPRYRVQHKYTAGYEYDAAGKPVPGSKAARQADINARMAARSAERGFRAKAPITVENLQSKMAAMTTPAAPSRFSRAIDFTSTKMSGAWSAVKAKTPDFLSRGWNAVKGNTYLQRAFAKGSKTLEFINKKIGAGKANVALMLALNFPQIYEALKTGDVASLARLAIVLGSGYGVAALMSMLGMGLVAASPLTGGASAVAGAAVLGTSMVAGGYASSGADWLLDKAGWKNTSDASWSKMLGGESPEAKDLVGKPTMAPTPPPTPQPLSMRGAAAGGGGLIATMPLGSPFDIGGNVNLKIVGGQSMIAQALSDVKRFRG